MRITLCVDALSPQLSGIGRYTWELCKGLTQNEELRSSLRFYVGGSLIDDPSRLLVDQHYRPRRRRGLRWISGWEARKALRSALVHGPNYFLPLESEVGVITIHDLSVFRYPETHPPSRLLSFERQFASSLERAVHVITDSETIRRELIATFSVPPEDVTAVPLGVDPNFYPMETDEIATTLAKWNLRPGEYGLSVSAFEPRKKIAELIRAWRGLPFSVKSAYPLVLAGAAGWLNEELKEDISAAESEGWLKFLGYVPEAELPRLYAGARLFIYPSIYEGFGLPPIEAMASGTPVIVADRSCLPEICGDAARFIDPDDMADFNSAIEQSLCDDRWRSATRTRGIERAGLYRWGRCVADTVEVYKKAWSQLG